MYFLSRSCCEWLLLLEHSKSKWDAHNNTAIHSVTFGNAKMNHQANQHIYILALVKIRSVVLKLFSQLPPLTAFWIANWSSLFHYLWMKLNWKMNSKIRICFLAPKGHAVHRNWVMLVHNKFPQNRYRQGVEILVPTLSPQDKLFFHWLIHKCGLAHYFFQLGSKLKQWKPQYTLFFLWWNTYREAEFIYQMGRCLILG